MMVIPLMRKIYQTRLVATLVLAASVVVLQAHAAPAKKYYDKDYSFSVSYPTDWVVMAGDNQGVREVMLKPASDPSNGSVARCQISVGRVPQRREYTQQQINRLYAAHPMTAQAWIPLLAPARPDLLKIIYAKSAKLFGNPANSVLADDQITNGKLTMYIREQVYMTNTPHLSWRVSCIGAGFDKGAAKAIFKSESGTYQNIVDSMKLLH